MSVLGNMHIETLLLFIIAKSTKKMNRIPAEIFNIIILLLEPEDRLKCSSVCKLWNGQISRGGLLYNAIEIHSLHQNAKTLRFFKNIDLSFKVKVVSYQLIGRLTVHQVMELPIKFPNVRHFSFFVCERHIGPVMTLRNIQKSFSTSNFFEATKSDSFDGWAKLTSIEETSNSMYTSFILNCSTKPFTFLTNIWLNYIHIFEHSKIRAMDYLTSGLKNSSNLRELTIQHAHLNLAHLDLIKLHCTNLHTLILDSVKISKPPPANKPIVDKNFIIEYKTNHSINEPTSSLKVLSIIASDFEKGLPLFSYISENYKDIQDLVCEARFDYGRLIYGIIENTAQDVIHQCRKLKHFKSNLFEWTAPFIELIDQHTETVLDEFVIDISDWAASTFISLCRSKRLSKSLKHLTYNLYQVPESLEINLLKFVNLTELNINFDCYIDDVDDEAYDPTEEIPVPPEIPFASLLQACKSLKYLSVGHLPIRIDSIPFEKHCIQEIHLMKCSLESYRKKYSLYNCISQYCFQLVDLEIVHGNYKYTPSVKELTLDLFNHDKLTNLTPLTNNVYHHFKHLDHKGANTWYLVRSSGPERDEFVHTLVKPAFDLVKSGKYITIKCDNPNVFYKEDTREFD